MPTSQKFTQTLDIPYAHLFRLFHARLNQPQTFLIVAGYGFGDDHVNRIVESALTNPSLVMLVVEPDPKSQILERIKRYQGLGQRAFVLSERVPAGSCTYTTATFADFAQNVMPDVKWLEDYRRMRAFEEQLESGSSSGRSDALMEQPRVIGHVVSVSGFRLKVELAAEAKSSSRATPDGVQRAVAINSHLTFDLGAGTHAIGVLSDLEARESYDPQGDEELTLQLTKPRRIASVQLLGTVRQTSKGRWGFDTGITVLPTLDTPAEVANPQILGCVFGQPPQRNRPRAWGDGDYDFALELGHQTGDENTPVKASFNDLFRVHSLLWAIPARANPIRLRACSWDHR